MNLHPAFADAFARALSETGVSLGELSRHLTLVGTPITTASLSYWRTGRSVPQRGSLPALANVEAYLRLPHGTLLDLVLPPDAERPRPLHDSFPSRQVAALLARVGVERFDVRDQVAFRAIWLHEEVLGPDEGAVLTQRYIVRARRGPIKSLAILAWSDPEPAELMTEFSPLFGARLGPIVVDEELRACATLLHLDREREVGERFAYGFQAKVGSVHPERPLLEHRVLDPGTLITLECEFATQQPIRVERSFIPAEDNEPCEVSVVEPVGNRYTAVHQDSRLGKFVLSWQW